MKGIIKTFPPKKHKAGEKQEFPTSNASHETWVEVSEYGTWVEVSEYGRGKVITIKKKIGEKEIPIMGFSTTKAAYILNHIDEIKEAFREFGGEF